MKRSLSWPALPAESTSWGTRATGASLVAGLAFATSHLVPPTDPPAVTLDCFEAILVDGRLVCGRADVAACESAAARGGMLRVGSAYRSEDCEWVPAGRMDPEDVQALGLPVDVNAAGVAELDTLPGIGPVLAGRVVERRPFVTVDELDEVRGIGPAKLRKLRPRARLGPTVIRGLTESRP